MNPYESPATEPSNLRVRLGYAFAALQLLPAVMTIPFWHLIFSIACHAYEFSDWGVLALGGSLLFLMTPVTVFAVCFLRVDFISEIPREL